MSAIDLCGELREGLSALYECAPAPRDGVRVRTPMMYPDGDIVDIFVLERDGSYTLTDFGETLAWLRMQSIGSRSTNRQLRLINDVCQTLGVELSRGQLVLRSVSATELGETVVRLAQAAVRVSDIWFTLRNRSFYSASEEVSEWLIEKNIKFEQSVKHTGRSGRDWSIDFRTYASEHTSMVFLLSTGSHNAARRITEHVVAGCVDLSHLKSGHPPVAFVSLFDDTSDVWRYEDFRMVESLSEVALWSRPDELEAILKAA